MLKKINAIGDYSEGRNNTFDLIRFFAASIVLLFHACVLSFGTNASHDPLFIFTNGQFHLGKMGVAIFFIVSGFLITQSYEKNNHVLKFFLNRALRIFPALIVLLLLTVFVLGPLVTTLPLRDYMQSPETYTYLKSVLLHPMYYSLPGVFANTDDAGIVNGSLWTLEFEFLCYILVGILGVIKMLRKEIILLFLLGVYWVSHSPDLIGNGYFASPITTELVKYFTVGMLCYLLRYYIIMHRYIAILSVILLVATSSFGHFQFAFTFCGTYLVMFFAFMGNQHLREFSKNGDYSYGLYIYSFPIQQLLVSLHGDRLNFAGLFLLSYPLTLIVAYFSWHLIEKRALNLKKYRFKAARLLKSKQTLN
ncbi:acyltransferase [Paenibacillus sp. YYML68]|uniref:acyltransferase family protein n=1 Tax=Paenibacillus sp. YYML68 TaxID=2909250 RepID=UPI0024902E77|nr:acyltransferase [Paenibacillus sp. YYML68]